MKKFMWTWARVVLSAAAVIGVSGGANANDVAAALEGSFLAVAGDAAANQIVISRNAAGDVVVAGQNGTLVNGVASVRFPRLQLNAAEILMGGGNDAVTLRGLQIANDLFVNLGDGADRLTVPAAAPIVVGNNMTVEGSGGNDLIRTDGVIVGQDLHIDGGVGVLNSTLVNITAGFNVHVIGDNANDILTLTSCAAGGDVFIEVKGGSDRVTLTDVSALLLGINTDANALVGSDKVTMTEVTTLEDIGIFTGPGNDIVQMLDVAAGKNLTVSADEGADRVSGANVSAEFDAIFEGGSGSDTFEDYGITGGTKKEVKEFETFLP